MPTTAELIAQADEDLANLSTGDLIRLADKQTKPAESPQPAAPKSNLRDDVSFLGSDKLGKAMSAVFPKTAKATAQGKGYGGRLLGSAQDVASPLRALRVLMPEVQTPDASGKMVNAKGESLPESYKDRLKMAGERLGDTQGPLADPGLVPALAAGVFTGGAPILAQGAAAGLASAAGHQAENLSEGRGFKPGQAVGEVALSALIPAALKRGGELAKKKSIQIIQTAFKAGKRVGGEKTLSPALAETALQKYGSLKGTERISENLSKVHDDINRQFDAFMRGPAKNKDVNVREALAAAEKRVNRLVQAEGVDRGQIDAIRSTLQKWKDTFGHGAADLGATTQQAGSTLKAAQSEAQALKGMVGTKAKEVTAATKAQGAAQSELSQAAGQIKTMKQHGTDFGWWYDDAKQAAKDAALKARNTAAEARAKLAVNSISQSDYAAAQAAETAASRRLVSVDAARLLQQGQSLDDVAARLSKGGKSPEDIAEILKGARSIAEQAKEIPGTVTRSGVLKFRAAQRFKQNTLDKAAKYQDVAAGLRTPELRSEAAAGRIARRKLSSMMTKIEPQLAPLNRQFKEVADIEPFVEQAIERQAANRGYSPQDIATMLGPLGLGGLGYGTGALFGKENQGGALGTALGSIPFLVSRGQKSPAAATALYRAGSQLAGGPGGIQLAIANLLRTYGGRGSEADSTDQ